MSEHLGGPGLPFDDDPSADGEFDDGEFESLAAILQDPAVWSEPAIDLEDAVVAAIGREMSNPADLGPETTGQAEVISIDRARRRWTGPVLAVAAAAIIAVAAYGLGSGFLAAADDPQFEVALAGTDLAPGASASAEVDGRAMGTRIVLDVSGLPPAPKGQYYEAWLRQSPEIGVSAGTFHGRGGDGTIELWAGVSVDRYPLITVTIQDEEGGAPSSGLVVLKGTIGG